jgi:hypothetical protein
MSGAAEAEADPEVLDSYGGALADAASEAHTGPRDQMGERLVRTFLTFWDDPEVRPALLGTFTAATTDEAAADQMRTFMSSSIFAQFGESLDGSPMSIEEVADLLGVPALNLNAAVSQVAGVILLRYVLEMEPIASASADELVAVLAPTIQRYLVG